MKILGAEDRVTPLQLRRQLFTDDASGQDLAKLEEEEEEEEDVGASSCRRCRSSPHLLIDVRPALEVAICRLPGSINVPFDSLDDRADYLRQLAGREAAKCAATPLPGNLLIHL